MQDLFVDFVLQKQGGSFIEFGAYDGVTYSNSYFLEANKGWRGVLAEPMPHLQERIAHQRPLATLDKRCVYSRTGDFVEFCEAGTADLSTIKGFEQADHMGRFRRNVNVYKVETVSLDDLILTHFPGGDVDYVSIDTEGSEWEIQQSSKFFAHPTIFTVEHNFTDNRSRIAQLMEHNGYLNIFPEYTAFDDWFVDAEVWRARFGK